MLSFSFKMIVDDLFEGLPCCLTSCYTGGAGLAIDALPALCLIKKH